MSHVTLSHCHVFIKTARAIQRRQLNNIHYYLWKKNYSFERERSFVSIMTSKPRAVPA